jgi:hypothetical protein
MLAALGFAATLAGCGGGAGSTSPGSVGGTPVHTVSVSSVGQTSTEAAFANASQAEADQAASNHNVGFLSLMGARTMSFGNLPYGTCVPDGTYAGTLLAAPVTSGGTTTYEITYFRDPVCSSKARDITITVTSSGAAAYALTRVVTNYDSSGATLTQRNSTIAVKSSPPTVSAQSTSVLSFAGAPVGSAIDEWSTTVTPGGPGVYALSGDGARITTGKSNAYGASHADSNATKTVNGDGTTTYAGTFADTLYMGAIGALSITPATFPGPFTVAPASDAVGSGTLNWTSTFDANGLPTSIQVSGTLAQGASLSVTTTAGPPISFNGTVTATSGSTLATFSVDQFGNGSVSFADGSSRKIYDWHAFKS